MSQQQNSQSSLFGSQVSLNLGDALSALGTQGSQATPAPEAIYSLGETLVDESGAGSTSTTPANKSRSDIWAHFRKAPNFATSKEVVCLYCTENPKVYKCTQGATSNLWTHMKRAHPEKLPDQGRAANSGPSLRANQPVDKERLKELFIQWVVAEDMPFGVFKTPSFRAILDALNLTNLALSATVVKRHVDALYAQKDEEIKRIIAAIPGKVSLTFDLWQSLNNISFLGVTAHYIDSDWRLRDMILDFSPMLGKHDGQNVGTAVSKICEKYGLLSKIQAITVDNAYSNNGAMEQVARRCADQPHPFTVRDGHIRCAAHVFNLAVKAMLGQLKISPIEEQTSTQRPVASSQVQPASVQHAPASSGAGQVNTQCSPAAAVSRPTPVQRAPASSQPGQASVQNAPASSGAGQVNTQCSPAAAASRPTPVQRAPASSQPGQTNAQNSSCAAANGSVRTQLVSTSSQGAPAVQRTPGRPQPASAQPNAQRNCVEKIRAVVKFTNYSCQRLEEFRGFCAEYSVERLSPILDIPTRWNSTYDMLKRALQLKQPLMAMVGAHTELQSYLLGNQEWRYIELLEKFLEPFETATNALCGSAYPTLTRTIKAYDYIFDSCREFASNNDIDDVFRSASGACIKKLAKYHANMAAKPYIISAILDPRFKASYFSNAGWRQEEIEAAKRIAQDTFDNGYYTRRNFVSVPQGANSPISGFANDEDSNRELSLPVARRRTDMANDMEEYLRDRLVPDSKGFKLLAWWEKEAEFRPELARMAKDYLAIQATSVAAERAFSRGGQLVSPNRASLAAETIQKCMCLKSWIKLTK